jgi:hypothetical protein
VIKLLRYILTPTGALRATPAIIIVFISFTLALGMTITYVAKARHEDDRRWCELLTTLSQPQPTTPPLTPQEVRGRRVAEEINQLRRSFGCDG